MEDYIYDLGKDGLIEVILELRGTIRSMARACENYRDETSQASSYTYEVECKCNELKTENEKLRKIVKESAETIGKTKADILDEAEKDELVRELSRRIGVEIHKVEPHEKKSIEVEGMACVAVVRL